MDEELTEKEALSQGLRPFTPPRQKKKRQVFNILHFKASTVCVLRLAGYTKTEICRITKLSIPTINKYLAFGRKEYPKVKNDLT